MPATMTDVEVRCEICGDHVPQVCTFPCEMCGKTLCPDCQTPCGTLLLCEDCAPAETKKDN